MNGVRILTTNDFVGSFFPQPTSYGRLPGAAALQAAVDDLRTRPAAGSGSTPATSRRAARSARSATASGRSSPCGVVDRRRGGRQPRARLGQPITCGAGAPSCRFRCWPRTCRWASRRSRCCAADGRVRRRDRPVAARDGGDAPRRDGSIPIPSGSWSNTRPSCAGEGARHVVLALHDGVDARPGADATSARPDGGALRRGARQRRPRARRAHAACYAGSLAGVPFLQPWAFGSQVGVADLARRRACRAPAGRRRPAAALDRRRAPRAQAALEAEVVGRLERAAAAGRGAGLRARPRDRRRGAAQPTIGSTGSTSVPATSGTSRLATACTPSSARAM